MTGNSFHIGRIFGINVRIDWSWLLIFFLITWNLAAGFGVLHPEWGAGMTLLLAVIASLLFFASVLAHELAHSVMARAQNVPVRDIVLFMFGGVSNIERDPPSPRAEFLITIVGPLTSLIIGVVLLFVANTALNPIVDPQNPESAVAQLGPVASVLGWLGSINVMLAVFNLIPGFPLDGGRVLRSILWAVTGNLRRATRWAAYVGQAIAWLMIVAGVALIFGLPLPLLGRGVVGGLWLIFIGWFLNNASAASYQRVVIQDLLQGVPVSRLMRIDPPTVPADITVESLVHDYVMRRDDYAFPVMDGDQLVGLVTMDDVRSVERASWPVSRVRDIMRPVADLVMVGPEEDAAEALNKLLMRDVRQLPVVHNGRLIGLLRRNDLVKWMQLQGE
ncbi:MAG: site-2 protease family protein [Chloroflexota bacterium]|nr:MAG: peptidase M50 [Chloroflexota bacterium]